jgi:hypothetical protein
MHFKNYRQVGAANKDVVQTGYESPKFEKRPKLVRILAN